MRSPAFFQDLAAERKDAVENLLNYGDAGTKVGERWYNP